MEGSRGVIWGVLYVCVCVDVLCRCLCRSSRTDFDADCWMLSLGKETREQRAAAE